MFPNLNSFVHISTRKAKYQNSRAESPINNNYWVRIPLSSTPPSIQQISSTQKGQFFSAPKVPQFHTENPSVQHNPLSSTHPPQFHPPQRKKTLKLAYIELFCVEMRGFWCGTEGFSVLNWRVLVWNWGILGLKRSCPFVWNWGGPGDK